MEASMDKSNCTLLTILLVAFALHAVPAAAADVAWQPLPPGFRGEFTMDMATMKKLVGDSIALPMGGRFTTLSVTAVEPDGLVRVKDLPIDAKLGGQPFKVVVRAFHSHVAPDAQGRYAMRGEGSTEPAVAFVWHDFDVQAPGGKKLNIRGAYRDGKLLGYTYDKKELADLAPQALVPVLTGSGWQVVKLVEPPKAGTLKIEGGKVLRLQDAGGRAALVP
jgi:hypothetical protein